MDYNLINQKLDELNLDGYKHIKNNDWYMPSNLVDWLEDHNFELMGEGLYSNVFSSETEKFIVKVNKGIIDKSYLSFIDFCHKNKGNPHLPKVGKPKVYEDWYIIFIEKLEPVKIEQLFKLDNYNDLVKFFKKVVYYFQEKHTRDEKVRFFYQRLEYYNFDILHSDPYVTQLYDICELMTKMCNELNYSPTKLDIHDDNIMLRGKTLVVTDPVM